MRAGTFSLDRPLALLVNVRADVRQALTTPRDLRIEVAFVPQDQHLSCVDT